VRATDEGLASMPRDMYWNATSMMNNWWFRVAVHRDGDMLRFEHPTLAGTAAGGWMERMNEEGEDPRYPVFEKTEKTEAAPKPKKEKIDVTALMTDPEKLATVVTRAQVAEHANETAPWFVVDGHVYDGTAFLEGHPGGSESITLVAGEDASEDFMAIHSMDAKKQMRAYHVGKLEAGGLAAQAEESEAELHDPARPFLRVKTWKRSLLGRRTKLSHDAAIYHFALDAPEQEVGLPIGQHVYLRLREADGKVVGEGEGTLIQRAYTPFSGNETKGELQILIKTYFPAKDGSRAGGKFTMLLESLRPGQDYVEMKGPLGHLQYRPGGVIALHGEERRVKRVAMIAGGSGITPIWSTLKGLLEDADATHVQIGIIDANRTESDILARTQLDEILASNAQRNVKLWHVLSGETQPEWSMGRGRITRDLLATHLPAPPSGADDDEALALICGPPPMEEVVVAALKELGWPESSIVQF
jgi:nitrate reductase (NAD(P)H)